MTERVPRTQDSIPGTWGTLQSDEEAFRALVLDADPWLLVVMLSKLSAELLEATVGDEWPRAMAMLAQFAVERAPS